MSYEHELTSAITAAREAGARLLAELYRPGGPRGGGDHADADTDAERQIRDRLMAATPFSFRGEELGHVAGADTAHVWVVDPNDGTSPFLQGARGPSVSIALVHDGRPVLGVVFAYACPDGDGDLLAWAEGTGPVRRNGTALPGDALAAATLAAGTVAFISQAADARAVENAECVAPARYVALPSLAYRLALVAAGEGVAAVSLAGSASWDYAGGHALLRGAGGELVDQDGRPVTYDARGWSNVTRCFGGAPAAVRELCQRPWSRVVARGSTPAASRPEGAYRLVGPSPERIVRDAGLLRRGQGCLLGQLAGDALGSLVEFRSAETIAAAYPAGVRDLADGGEWDTLAGQPTDDSEMALMLARSIVARGRYDAAAALDAYVHWHDSSPFDMGGTTRAALQAASRAPSPGERMAGAAAAAKQESQANGSLMRVSPLGLLGARRPAEAVAWARADSGLTHPHRVCREACAAYVAALVAAVGEGAGPEAAHRAACTEAERGGEPAVIEALALARTGPPESFTRHEGWVLIALRNAFFQLLHAPSVEEGVVATVMSGGDTDTNGAIAGALLGAVHGREAVPRRWRQGVLTCRPLREVGALQPRGQELWAVDALVLAEALLAIGGG